MTDPLIVILDDNEAFRESTAWLLEGYGYEVSRFADPTDAIACIERIPVETPCCLLLDIRMPSMSGLDVHDELARQRLTLPVIYMTAHGEVSLAVNAMQKGAFTFLEKPLDETALRSAIAEALSPDNLRRRLSAAERDAIAETGLNITTLTPRETEILNLIMEDKTNKEIARYVDISVKTVEMHRSRVMKKLGVRSAAQLVRMVYAHRAQ